MQTRTNLGLSLGQMLSGMTNGNAFNQGQAAGADINYKKFAADKLKAEADKTRADVENSSDNALFKSLTAGLQNGINGDNVTNDFSAYASGSYKPRQQQGAMMPPDALMPEPEYVKKFPALVQQLSKLQQMRALGDKDLTHLSKAIQGDQRNDITANLATATPQQVADIGMKAATLESNVNPLEMQRAVDLRGLTNGNNSLDAQNAVLLGSGKTRFDDMNGKGSIDLLTGNNILNDLGNSEVTKNKADATQSMTGANLNNANIGLTNAKVGQTISATGLNNANIGLVNEKVNQTKSATNLNNVNADNAKNKSNGNLGALDSIDTAMESLKKISQHEGLSPAVGASSAFNKLALPSSDRANFLVELEAFKSQMFVPMVQQMKGMGQLSDAEGKKLMAAVGALDPSMSESEFRSSAYNIMKELKIKRARAVGDKRSRDDLIKDFSKTEATTQSTTTVTNW